MLSDRSRDPWTTEHSEARKFADFNDALTFKTQWEERNIGSKPHYQIFVRKL